MKILMISAGRSLADELKRRGHEVQLCTVLEPVLSSGQQTMRCRFAHKRQNAALIQSAGQLRRQLAADSYDAVVADGLAGLMLLSEAQQEAALSLMICLSAGEEGFPRKQSLPCDVYIVGSDAEKKRLIRRGIAPALIHTIDAPLPAAGICALIEEEAGQWTELKRAFDIKV